MRRTRIMSLSPGMQLGPYEVLSPIGAGGMGEVYRARDTRLGRDVAIKILPAAFAADHDRMVRFQREAHVLASLNHPHIASIFGFEESNATRALVMELVEGPTLDERIAQGAMPLDEALPIARQIAEALEYAHEHGIVHRDLKPANVKLTRDGAVKVLDFGLAKALSDDPLSPDVSNSPTFSAVATRAGTILGTAAYMSPEQAKGKTADRRCDIWSFGVVLYEMLTGRRLFTGDTAAETLAAVLRAEPDWNALTASAPARVRRLLRRCLEKDPRRRMQAIGEARIAIEDALGGAAEETALAVPEAALWRQRGLLWALGGVLIGAALVRALWAPQPPAPEPPTPVRLSVELGTDGSLVTGLGPATIISPDGKLLAFTARKAARQPPQLHVRRLDQLRATPLSGTEGARNPFFSPDSQWLGFFAAGKLKKVAVSGSATVTLGDAPEDRGGTWSDDGTIFFTPRLFVRLSRVSSAGGTAEVLSTDQAVGTSSDRWPQALPGGRAVLFTAGAAGDFEGATIVVQPLPKGPRKVLQRGGYYGRYVRSGHIVYIHEGRLFAAPFDLGRLELTGPPAPVLEGVTADPASGAAQFAFSDRGTLVFLPGQGIEDAVPIQWMGQDGKTEPLRGLAGNYGNIQFSPDGQRLALDVREGRERDVWVYEWGRDLMSRLTFDPAEDLRPVWTPDGRRIAFASTRADTATANLYWQRADGTGEAVRLSESNNPQYPVSWHPSGKFLAFHESDPQTSWDLLILPMEGDDASGWKPGKPTTFLSSPYVEGQAAFSPDGKWLAYNSNESGQFEIYVRPFPGPGGKWQASTGGGLSPTWSRNRKELFYRTPESTLMVVPYAVEGDSFRAEKPRQWSPGLVPRRGGPSRAFDLHPDGQRLAVLKAAEEQAEDKRDHVTLVENFFDELRRVAPAGKR